MSKKNETASDYSSVLKNYFKQMEVNDELEIGFYSYLDEGRSIHLNMEGFRNVLQYMNARQNDKTKLENHVSLDVIYNPEKGDSYRLTIDDQKEINKYMRLTFNRKNHIIYKILLMKLKKLIRKKKESFTILEDYDMKVRLSHEEDVDSDTRKKLTNNVDETQRKNIIYRHKHRASLIILDDENYTIRIDLTTTKTHRNIQKLEFSRPAYELELEIFKKGDGKGNYVKTFIDESIRLQKVLQQSNYLVTKNEQKDVLEAYANLVGINLSRAIGLDARQAISLEIQNVLDILPNRYSVTDKADGDRYFLIIHKGKAYLISNSLRVKYTGITVENAEYEHTLLDGEYIFIPKTNRYIFMGFDILFHKGKDVRQTGSIIERVKLLTDVMDQCFTLQGHMAHKFEPYEGKYDAREVLAYYKSDMTQYLKILNYNIKLNSDIVLVQRKYYIFPMGAQDNEIFKYAKLFWDVYVYSGSCPYHLDGLMFTPIEQKYHIPKESPYQELKFKPPNTNSMDFYIQFLRDQDTGQIMKLFDNQNIEALRGKPYQIAYLHVGRFMGGEEKPVLFQRKFNKYIAYMFLQDNHVRDLSGEILQDGTVCEFYYLNDPNVDERFQWVPIRTRYDKTESVMRFRRRYGNSANTANKVWRSIVNPFTLDDIIALSGDASFVQQSKRIRERVTHGLITTERRENVYYQIQSNLANPMRKFHNWVKDSLIWTFCGPQYDTLHNIRIFDIGCGRGGDIMKFYYTRIDFYVGIDIEAETLISAVDGAISRYKQMRQVHKNFPKMFFIHADAGVPFTLKDQSHALKNMDEKNKDMIHKFFEQSSMDFDRVNCQFAIHYFLADDTVWGNFCNNLNKVLRPGGYFIITTFDGRKIMKLLENTDRYTGWYNDEKGEKKKLFEIVRKYEIKDTEKKEVEKNGLGTGYTIDFHLASFMLENKYVPEYLVDPIFLKRELKEKCQMNVIDTGLFSNLYNLNREYFMHVAPVDTNLKTRKNLLAVSPYYTSDQEIDKVSLNLTNLFRYYVFQRADDEKYVLKPREVVSKRPIFKQRKEAQMGGYIQYPEFVQPFVGDMIDI